MAFSRLSGIKPDMDALQDEFAKYLIIAREKSAEAQESTKSKLFARFNNLKQRVKDTIDTYKALDKLRPDELAAVTKFMEQVKSFKDSPPPPPLKRPEGLELNLIGIALFSGDELVSRTIRRITNSSYSHVALLLYDITKDPNDPDGWHVYSANGSASQIMADHRLPQVQLEKWSETIAAYEGAVVTRLIKFAPESMPSSSIITELVDKYIGMPYENQLLIMLKAMNRANKETEHSADSAFCSEVCYRFLTAANIVIDSEVPENVWPKDFSVEGKRLKLASGAWADQVLIKGIIPPKPR